MFKKSIPQHKRIAQGGEHTPLGYSRGGRVTVRAPSVGTAQVEPVNNPLTTARRNNGVKGMKKGGSAC